MTIDTNDPRITAYVFDELSGEDKAEFEQALAGSDELQQLVRQTRRTVEVLAGDLRQEPPVRLSDKQRQRVAASINGPQAEQDGSAEAPATIPAKPPVKPGGSSSGSWRWLSVAACVLLIGGVSVALLRQQVIGTNANLTFQDIADNIGAGTRAESASSRNDDESREMDNVGGDLVPESYDPAAARTKRPATGAAPKTAAPAPVSMPTPPLLMREPNSLPASPDMPVTRAAPADSAAPEDRADTDEGTGPGFSGDQFDRIYENVFLEPRYNPLSTFSIDVDTASYSKVRQFLIEQARLPRPDAVRIEELVNYFPYDYEPPAEDAEHPFAAHMEVTDCPWAPKHRLVRVALKGKEFQVDQRPAANLVFLIDVSGSMKRANKLPLLVRGMKQLASQLEARDRVALVVYAGAAGLVLDSTPGDEKRQIVDALSQLSAGGSTNGGEGIRLAYQTALDNYIEDGVNRVILCSDGDFNVGVTGTDSLVRMAERNAKSGVFLTVLGFGMGNHNDAMLEQISNKGNGNYAFIDTDNEARKVLVEQMEGTLVTIAKDVKIQVDFTSQVVAYRLIGYENRMLAAEDFLDDKKDAGEIGAGHTVTALYEIVPAGGDIEGLVKPVAESKFHQAQPSEAARDGQLLELRLKYKQPDNETSEPMITIPLIDEGKKFGEADRDFRFAAAVASFGMLLRDSKYKGDTSYDAVLEIASEAAADDPYRQEFLQLVRQARDVAP